MLNRKAKTIDQTTDSFTSEYVPHAVSAEEIAEFFGVETSKGLSTETVKQRIREDGENKIKVKRTWRGLRLFLEQFSSIVVWLLAIAAAVAFFTDNVLEAAAILVVLLINAAIGFIIEWQAARTLDALKKATRMTARVRRDGREQIIDSEELVRGDLLVLSAGDGVPADSRIFESANLQTDESTLTGESVPVQKSAEKSAIGASVADRRSMLYLGTTIVSGNALAIVTGTGERTEIGGIGKLVAGAEGGKTPLERKLSDLGKTLVYVVLGIAGVVFISGYLRGDGIWLMLEVSISLAVAAVPEGLPAVTTLILALGVLRMARRHAIVRKLSAVETLGSTTVICTDKTGTLTENRMTVQEFRLANDRLIKLPDGNVSGSGGRHKTDFHDEDLRRLLMVSVLCNDSVLEIGTDGQEKMIGDPTETALLSAFQQLGFEIQSERSGYTKLYEQPFDSTAKRMVTVVRENRSGQITAAIKGAPGVILDSCHKYASGGGKVERLTDEKRAEFLKLNEEMANRALRVLGFAEKELDEEQTNFKDESFRNTVFLGFAGMTDPPRAGAAEYIKRAQSAGIRVVMLTGDQLNTAQAIARQLDLSQGENIFALHSSEMAESNDHKFALMARKAHVFARVSPADKLNIVTALQSAGEIVAVTGDGVNDAPALKQSDIGIAMGKRGTEVAKEASDIVLTDDDFSTIVKAIEGGRTIYANIIKFVHLLFSDNFAEVLVIFFSIMLGLPLPLLPLQILWVNLVTDIFPALALAVEPASPDTMRRKPHPPGEALLTRQFLLLIFWKGFIYSVIVLASYYWALQTYGPGAHSRTIALLSLIGVQIGNLFNCRSRTRSAFYRFFSNPFIFVAVAISFLLQIMAIYLPPLARILDTTVPNNIDYLVISISVILPVVILEVQKAIVKLRSGKTLH